MTDQNSQITPENAPSEQNLPPEKLDQSMIDALRAAESGSESPSLTTVR